MPVSTVVGKKLSFRSPPDNDLGSLRDRAVELILQTLGGGRGRQRADLGVVGRRVPRLGLLHLRGELLQEVVVEVVGDDEPLRGVARLARVVQAGVDGGLDGLVEVAGAQQDERVRAAELEHDLLQVAAGDLGDGAPRRARSPSARRPGSGGRRSISAIWSFDARIVW